MNYTKEYQYKNLAATEDTRIYNGTLYVVPTDDTRNIVTSPVNKLTGTNATTTQDIVVSTDTLSNQSGKIPFSISCSIHSDIWQTSIRQCIFRMPGLLEVWADAGSLIFHPHVYPINQWYKIKPELLTTGWNTLSFYGDGENMDLDVNTAHIHLFTDDYHEYYKKTYSSFSSSKYLYLPSGTFTPANWSRWRMQYHLITPSNSYVSNDMRVCGTANNTNLSQLVLGAYQKHPVFWLCKDGQASGWSWAHDSGFTITGSQLFNATSNWWYAIEFTGSQYIVSTSTNGSSFTQYAYLDTTERLTNRNTPYRMGSCENSGYWRGSLILDTGTFIEAEGSKVFSGDRAVLNTNYFEQGSMTVTSEEASAGIAYPIMNIGKLETYQSVFYLKNLQAIKLED
jgi:hypothetical protein